VQPRPAHARAREAHGVERSARRRRDWRQAAAPRGPLVAQEGALPRDYARDPRGLRGGVDQDQQGLDAHRF